MQTKVEHKIADNGAQIKVATITHDGHEFTALGSIIDHERGIIVGYVSKRGELTTFEGKLIPGALMHVSSWRTPGSYVNGHMHAYRFEHEGVRYHGRGAGAGMILRLYRNKGKRDA